MRTDDAKAAYRRRVIARYKRLKGCVDCGYKANSAALEFDHIDETTKYNTIGSMMWCKWDRIKAEIAKCVVRCANCHAIRSLERNYRKNMRF